MSTPFFVHFVGGGIALLLVHHLILICRNNCHCDMGDNRTIEVAAARFINTEALGFATVVVVTALFDTVPLAWEEGTLVVVAHCNVVAPSSALYTETGDDRA